MNLLDEETHSFEGKRENETTVYRKRKSLIPGEQVTPKGKEENERTVSWKHKALIQGQNVTSNEKVENEMTVSQKQKALNLGEKVTATGREGDETTASWKRKALVLKEKVEENELTVSQKQEALIMGEKVTPNSRKAIETPKRCLASIVPENIMLVYLIRSSIQYLLKDPETFECNVVGSYVRIPSNPNDYSQKNSHQLLQVAGVKKARDDGEECIIQVLLLPLIKDIPISMLSDEYFKKEECMDLYQKMRAGVAYWPTVMELQSKAQMLHKVITKQWLARELSLMQNRILQDLIDRNKENGWCATDKGWRKELFEYLKREAPLQKPAEQEKILLTVPNVITEDLKSDISCFPKLSVLGTSAASAGVDEEDDTTFVKEANDVLDLNVPHVVDISDDDDDELQGDNPDHALWYYKDNEQVPQGPFPAILLKRWKENGSFPQGLEVWKHGHAPLLLDDMIMQMFCN